MNIREYGCPEAGTVLIQPVDGHDLACMDGEVAHIRRLAGDGFRLIAAEVGDWNRDLSPWPAPAVFGGQAFGGGARDTLDELIKIAGDRSKTWIVGGYSLAGLFALWAASQTDVFSGVAAASPSVWFPGFMEHMAQHPLRAKRVYLSLGDRESRTRNPVMAAVGDCIRRSHAILTEQGVDCALEWNPGNHFTEPDLRTAKAFAWVMRRQRGWE